MTESVSSSSTADVKETGTALPLVRNVRAVAVNPKMFASYQEWLDRAVDLSANGSTTLQRITATSSITADARVIPTVSTTLKSVSSVACAPNVLHLRNLLIPEYPTESMIESGSGKNKNGNVSVLRGNARGNATESKIGNRIGNSNLPEEVKTD